MTWDLVNENFTNQMMDEIIDSKYLLLSLPNIHIKPIVLKFWAHLCVMSHLIWQINDDVLTDVNKMQLKQNVLALLDLTAFLDND